MAKYSCERCGKKISQTITMILMIDTTTPREHSVDKLKTLVDKTGDETLNELNIVQNEEVI